MGIFRKRRKAQPSKDAKERLEQARTDLQEQLNALPDTIDVQQRMDKILKENHIADLMFEALAVKRGDT
jgi:hypothetical protein